MIADIIDAQMERVRDFGPGHEIQSWPLSLKEWLILLDEIGGDRRSADTAATAVMAGYVELHTQFGKIRVFRGP